jgi:hypothetical protein
MGSMRAAAISLLLLLATACSTASTAPSDGGSDATKSDPSPGGYPCGTGAAGSSTTYCYVSTFCLQSTVSGQIVSGTCLDLTAACPPGGDADLPDCACVEQSAGLTGCTCSSQQDELVLTCPLSDGGSSTIPDAGASADAGIDAPADAPAEAMADAGLAEAASDASADAPAEATADAMADAAGE